ncbi:MAG TPA: ABC transporter permease [Methylomusa anaerophila]|uniref:Putative aliphatic sulfonates transport permease protein SsuC n=1 Tax=Methylomusa anaerophila TaxID=1930071 RepID=A0A348AEY4_9FIRM|nr:ABC transporter permease [Methylomusa anaerophila]BBB89632.1 putative aliphatic sulfonates transport permease protein SsuC [Methylomusa anaerophila]HML89592.1 ABC transporter permease [Methylomusa anaerophila]
MNFIQYLLKIGVASWLAAIGIWQLASLTFGKPDFLPGPLDVVHGLMELLADGSWLNFVLVSLRRVLAGWLLGSLWGAPIGLLIGHVKIFRQLIDPYLNFFRFIPSIAFITLFVLWFGIGEESKLILIMYGTSFIVMLNTASGVLALDEEKIRAARSLGASETQIFFHVVIPATIPYIFTGVRLAMGNSFMAIVGAEMIAANEGIGYLIWTSRLYFKTDWVFIGLISLGLMGFFTDKLIRVISAQALGRYGITTENRFGGK